MNKNIFIIVFVVFTITVIVNILLDSVGLDQSIREMVTGGIVLGILIGYLWGKNSK